MLVFGDCLEIKNSSLARLCGTDRCNFVREHGIGGNMESVGTWNRWNRWNQWNRLVRLVQLVQLVQLGRVGQMGQGVNFFQAKTIVS